MLPEKAQVRPAPTPKALKSGSKSEAAATDCRPVTKAEDINDINGPEVIDGGYVESGDKDFCELVENTAAVPAGDARTTSMVCICILFDIIFTHSFHRYREPLGSNMVFAPIVNLLMAMLNLKTQFVDQSASHGL